MSVQTNLVKLYEGKGDADLLKISANHRMLLRAIVDTSMQAGHYRYRNKFNNNSIYQPYVMDLLSWGLIELRRDVKALANYDAYVDVYTATNYGVAVQAYFNLKSKKNVSGHNMIIYDLQSYLSAKGSMVFDDIEIKTQYGVSRPDVFSIERTLTIEKMKPTAYEIKHSRADFLSDMKKPSKWKSYLEMAERLYYVCPDGLIKKEEVPAECGLIYQIDKNKFNQVKNAKKGNGKPTVELMMKLLLKDEADKMITVIKPGYSK